MSEQLVGSVSHFFGKAGVIALEMTGRTPVGDTIHVVGHLTDFTETGGVDADRARAGDRGEARRLRSGIKVVGKAREGDDVYRVLPG